MDNNNQEPSESSESPETTAHSFTLRAVLVGLFLGLFICICNVYYGLRVSYNNSMSQASSLLGYAIFRVLAPRLTFPFSKEENVLIQTVAGAAGSMPATTCLLGIIPALGGLVTPGEGGPVTLSYLQLLLWAIGISFFGLFVTMVLRDQLVISTDMPYPGAQAAASVILMLHSARRKFIRWSQESNASPSARAPYLRNPHQTDCSTHSEQEVRIGTPWTSEVRALTRAAIGSGILTLVTYFLPILRHIPIFGAQAGEKWLWSLDLSAGFLGTGIITGLEVPLHMLCGAVVGWGILSPMARSMGWAPGEIDDLERGSRGWILWISLSSLLADCLMSLFWPLAKLFIDRVRALLASFWNKSSDWLISHDEAQTSPLISERAHSNVSDRALPPGRLLNIPFLFSSRSGSSTIGLVVSSIICALTVKIVFDFMPTHFTIIAVAFSLPLSVIGVRSVGAIAYNPISGIGKVSQLLLASIIPHSHPNAIVINLVAGGLAEAGAKQAGDIAHDLKVGHSIGARSEAQLYGEIFGCLAGAFISCALYKLYTSVYTIPGEMFRVPMSHLAVLTARLVNGHGLPDRAASFAIGFGILFAIITVIKIQYADRNWSRLLPGGVPFAIGIYNVPSFTLIRVLGGLISWYCSSIKGYNQDFLVVIASGLLLGEGLVSIVNLGLSSANVPFLAMS